MVYSLKYRRPAYISSSRASINTKDSVNSEASSVASSCSYGIPEALSFDKIVNGETRSVR